MSFFTTSRVIDGFGSYIVDRKGQATSIDLFIPIGMVYRAAELRQVSMEVIGRPYVGAGPPATNSALDFWVVRRSTSAFAEDDGDRQFSRIADSTVQITSYGQMRSGFKIPFTIRDSDIEDEESVYLKVRAAGPSVNTSIWYHVDAVVIGLDWWDGTNEQAEKPKRPAIDMEKIGDRK